jgi:hypothetical protein
MIDQSTNVGSADNSVIAGGIGTKANYNPKDDFRIKLWLIIAIAFIIIMIVLVSSGQLDKLPVIGEFLKVFLP